MIVSLSEIFWKSLSPNGSDPKVVLLAEKVFLQTASYAQNDSHGTGICNQDVSTPNSLRQHAMLVDSYKEKTIIVLMTITEDNCAEF